MQIEVFNSLNQNEYAALTKQFDLNLDIYYDPKFLEIDAKMQKGDFEIFTVIAGQSIFIYPYIKLSLHRSFSEYFDLTSPYGYCGPYCNDEKLFYDAESHFLEYAKRNSIVSEFIRYHYLYNQSTKFKKDVQNILNRSIVTLDLGKSWDDIWMKEMSGTNRNIVRKLQKEGCLFELSNNTEHLEEFIDLYNSTMDNVKAEGFYYFEKQFYYDLFQQLKGKIFLARVIKENDLLASALFFESGGIATYFLSARNLKFQNVPASNLMLTEMARLAHERNMNLINFGGGRTTSTEDALLKFKKNFSKDLHEFYIGKRVHNKDLYESLKSEFITNRGEEAFDKVKHMLQFYRQ